jgi:hypothetical protein
MQFFTILFSFSTFLTFDVSKQKPKKEVKSCLLSYSFAFDCHKGTAYESMQFLTFDGVFVLLLALSGDSA